MRIVKISCLLSLFFFSEACSDQCGSPLPVPVISHEEILYEGEEVVLTARGNESHDYTWQGPNGFRATGQIQILENAQVYDGGNYTVIVSKEDCSGVSNTTFLEILPLPVPCQPEANTVRFAELPGQAVVDAQPATGIAPDINLYQIVASSSNGEVIITFPSADSPRYNRSYLTGSEKTALTENEVEILVKTGNPSQTYLASSGRLYVRFHSSGYHVYFCGLQFRDGSDVLTGTGHLDCDP